MIDFENMGLLKIKNKDIHETEYDFSQ